MLKPIAELDSAENLKLHRIGWKAQRYFRVVLVLFVVAAALGCFGTGYLSNREIRLGTSLVVRSERIGRVGTDTRLDVLCLTGSHDNLIVVVPHGTLERYKLQMIWPEPIRQTSIPEGIEYAFQRVAGSHAVFSFQPQQPGRTKGSLILDRKAVDFSQFIYP